MEPKDPSPASNESRLTCNLEFFKNKYVKNMEGDTESGAQDKEADWEVCHCTEEDCVHERGRAVV